MVKQVRNLDQFEREYGGTPSDVGFDQEDIAALTDALVRVQLLGSPAVEAAATTLADAMAQYVYGPLTHEDLLRVWEPFRRAAREDLVGRS